MASDSTVQAKVQHLDGGDRLCVASGGKLELAAGSTLDVSGTATMVGMVPKPPAVDGDYVLHIASGVATWVPAS